MIETTMSILISGMFTLITPGSQFVDESTEGTVSCDTVLAYKRRTEFNSMKILSGHSQVAFPQNTPNILTQG